MFWLVLCSLWAAQPGAGRPAVLGKVRQGVLDNLRRLPNYTCTQTIERSERRAASLPFENVDRVRLAVGYIDGKELFGWPGGEKLAVEDVRRLVGGTISNGDFATVASAVFAGGRAVFGEIREENHAGRAMLRCDFTVPRAGTDWILLNGERRAPTGYHGALWVDANSLQLAEIRITADDIPRDFGYTAVTRDLQFASVRIGSGDFPLPSRAELWAAETSGAEVKNETRFHDCREYTAESVITFGPSERDFPSDAPAPGPAATLPDKFEASLALEAPIDSDTSAVGDPIRARLQESIKRKGETLVPKGTIFHGRIARLEVAGGHRRAELAFTYFEAGGRRVEIGGRRNEMVTLTRHMRFGETPEQGLTRGPIRASGSHLVLPRGYPFFLISSGAAGER